MNSLTEWKVISHVPLLALMLLTSCTLLQSAPQEVALKRIRNISLEADLSGVHKVDGFIVSLDKNTDWIQLSFQTDVDLTDLAMHREIYSYFFPCSKGSDFPGLGGTTSKVYRQGHPLADLAGARREEHSVVARQLTEMDMQPPYIYEVYLALPKATRIDEDICFQIDAAGNPWALTSSVLVIDRESFAAARAKKS